MLLSRDSEYHEIVNVTMMSYIAIKKPEKTWYLMGTISVWE